MILKGLDIRTLALCVALVFSGLVLHLAYYQLRQKTYRGFGYWTFGCTAVGCGVFCLMFKDILPEMVAVFLINGFLFAGFLSFYAGFHLFAGKAFPFMRHFLIMGAALLTLLILVPLDQGANGRIVVMSLVSACYFFGILVVLERDVYPMLNHRDWVLSAAFAFLAGILVLRAAVSLVADAPILSLDQWGGIHKLLLAAMLLVPLLIITEITALTAKKLENENLKNQAEIEVLRGLLPVCSNCKKIRGQNGNWEEVEHYIQDRSEVRFSHSICPDCIKKLYPEIAEDVLNQMKDDGSD